MNVLSELGRRRLLIVTVAVAAAGATAAFSFTAAKRYRATAVLVVQPVSPATPAFLGLDVLHDTSRRSAAATAARLVHAPEVAEAVRVRLGLHGTAQDLLDKVSSHVVGSSNAVDVTATDTSPARAAQIANGFVDAFVTQRSAGFQSELQSEIRRLRLQLASLPRTRRGGAQGAQLSTALAQLQRWVGFADPTVRHGSEAVQPRSAAWPHPFLWTLYGGLIGLVAGCVAALALALAVAVRRRRVVRVADYDPHVPDRTGERVVERLEARLAERVDALAAEQARLAAREASLAARERDLEAALEEARKHEETPAPAPSPAAADAEAERRASELAERAQVQARRERAVAARAAELKAIETRVDEERRSLAGREEELRTREERAAHGSEELGSREQALAGREQALNAREQALRDRAEALAERERDLVAREHLLEAREQERREAVAAPAPPPALEPRYQVPAPASAPAEAQQEEPPSAPEQAPAAVPPRSNGGWHLDELEQLVERHAADYPEHADEWRSYLFYLRDYTDASGRVPAHFDWLVEDTFGELLVRR